MYTSEFNYCHHRSQCSYTNGNHACTSVGFFWLMACFLKCKSALFTGETIEHIMRWACDYHAECCSRLGYSVSKNLNQDEITSHITLPNGISLRFGGGHKLDSLLSESDHDQEKGLIFHMAQVPSFLKPNSGILITANNHSIALFCNSHGQMWLFDSLPAIEKQYKVVTGKFILSQIEQNLGSFEECSLLFISNNPGEVAC